MEGDCDQEGSVGILNRVVSDLHSVEQQLKCILQDTSKVALIPLDVLESLTSNINELKGTMKQVKGNLKGDSTCVHAYISDGQVTMFQDLQNETQISLHKIQQLIFDIEDGTHSNFNGILQLLNDCIDNVHKFCQPVPTLLSRAAEEHFQNAQNLLCILDNECKGGTKDNGGAVQRRPYNRRNVESKKKVLKLHETIISLLKLYSQPLSTTALFEPAAAEALIDVEKKAILLNLLRNKISLENKFKDANNKILVELVTQIDQNLKYIEAETDSSLREKVTELSFIEKKIKALKDQIASFTRKGGPQTTSNDTSTFLKQRLHQFWRKFDLLHGKIYLPFYYLNFLKQILTRLEDARDKLWMQHGQMKANLDDETLKKVQLKAMSILRYLQTRKEIMIVWNDREAKGFHDANSEWAEYECCIAGNFKSKVEMLDSLNRGLNSHKDYLNAQRALIDLRMKYKVEYPQGDPFVCACHSDRRINDIKMFVQLYGILNDERCSLSQMINQINKTINGRKNDMHSPLMVGVYCEQVKVVDYLLSLDCIDLTVANESGANVFHFAALNERSDEILIKLLNHKKSVSEAFNKVDLFGNTPLDYAHAINNSNIKSKIIKAFENHGGLANCKS